MLRALEPDDPVQCIRPDRIFANARRFLSGFPGRVAYAVKANPHAAVLEAVRDAGVGCFDVASIEEVDAVDRICPGTELFFHHPVKSRGSIREARQRYGVRRFVVDHADELAKVFEETGGSGITVLIRVAYSGVAVAQDFSSKFGATPDEAVALLRTASAAGIATGLAFHIGTHCTDPAAYASALRHCGDILARAGTEVECLSVGGGFPGAYAGQTIPPLERYFEIIDRAWRELALPRCVLICEPGRALVADGASIVTRVRMRRGDRLYIGDGPSGCLGDLWYQRRDAPIRVYRTTGQVDGPRAEFRLTGPLSCDSNDDMPGVFSLPAGVRAEDWIEIGELGAYGAVLAADVQDFDDVPAVTIGEGADDDR
jgi:ornithine decarboxylase